MPIVALARVRFTFRKAKLNPTANASRLVAIDNVSKSKPPGDIDTGFFAFLFME